MPTTFQIGSTLGGIADLSDLTTPVVDPEADFTEYAETVTLANGLVRGLGLPTARWRYGFLPEAQYDQLRSFCSGASASVFISTLTNGNSYATYSAVMQMPLTYQIRAGRYIDIEIQFTNLVAQ